ncbi:hypothetical protein C8039_04720 [Halogeometricum sp. wsp3]|nr:hypothetical protein C8039_04720 [Halogeometricum sp. wsp3]
MSTEVVDDSATSSYGTAESLIVQVSSESDTLAASLGEVLKSLTGFQLFTSIDTPSLDFGIYQLPEK